MKHVFVRKVEGVKEVKVKNLHQWYESPTNNWNCTHISS